MAAPLNHTTLALTPHRYPDGYESPKVPAHITVIPWFKSSILERPGVQDRMDIIMECAGVLSLQADELIEVGNSLPARRIRGGGLNWLHSTLYGELLSAGAKFSDPQWLGKNYTPHITMKPEDDIAKAVDMHFDEIAYIHNVAQDNSRGIKVFQYAPLGTMVEV